MLLLPYIILGTIYEKELQKTNKDFRVEKVIKKKRPFTMC